MFVFLIPLFIIAVVLVRPIDTKAGVYDDAYFYYHTFSRQNLMQARDGYIYIGNRGKEGASTSPFLYVARGHRFTLELDGISYYVDLKRSLYGGVYSENISMITVGGYVYNLYRISYQSLCQLLQYNYPYSNLRVLYDQSRTVHLLYDSIMTIKIRQKNGTYSLQGDMSYDNWGRPVTWGKLYDSNAKMSAAWKRATRQTRDFKTFYGQDLVIPGSEKERFITTTAIDLKEKEGVSKQNNLYYVKAGLAVDLSYGVMTSFASETFQTNYVYLDVKDRKTNQYIATQTLA